MTEQSAIAVMTNMLHAVRNTLRYRKENDDEIKIEEYMMPDALEIVLDMANKNHAIKIVNDITKGKNHEKDN